MSEVLKKSSEYVMPDGKCVVWDRTALEAALADDAKKIDQALMSYLPVSGERYGVIYEAMRYSAEAGGKRIRPFLTLNFCRLFGGSDEAALPFAAAVEMIHTYSLIHDDLPCMDNDGMRRGKPSNHVRFGEATALLAGDALLTHAFAVASSNKAVSAAAVRDAVAAMACEAGPDGMIAGQVLDMIGERESFPYETLLQMNRKKTGCLIRLSCILGCIAAGQSDFTAANAYGDALGLSFQIIDDLLDAGSEDEKTTFLTFMSREKAYELAAELTDRAVDALAHTPAPGLLSALAFYLLERKK